MPSLSSVTSGRIRTTLSAASTRHAPASALGTIMLLSALEANGLTMQDVRVRTLTVDDHLAAFQAGEVDALVTFEDDRGAYDQRDAAGFIKLNALRLRLLGRRDGR